MRSENQKRTTSLRVDPPKHAEDGPKARTWPRCRPASAQIHVVKIASLDQASSMSSSTAEVLVKLLLIVGAVRFVKAVGVV